MFSPQELKALSAKGAVGDICLRFFDAAGHPVSTPLNDRVISIDLDSLQRIDRVVGVAGGRRKTAAIRGALEGHWVNVLITDLDTAQRLLSTHAADVRRPRAEAAGASSRVARARA